MLRKVLVRKHERERFLFAVSSNMHIFVCLDPRCITPGCISLISSDCYMLHGLQLVHEILLLFVILQRASCDEATELLLEKLLHSVRDSDSKV